MNGGRLHRGVYTCRVCNNGLTVTPGRQQICISTEASGGHKALNGNEEGLKGGTHSGGGGGALRSPVPAAQPAAATRPIPKSWLRGCEWKGWENNY